MMQNNSFKITQILNDLNVETLASSTQFKKRKPIKINATDFLVSFCHMMYGGKFSLRNWASCLSSITGKIISFQALAKKLQFRHLHFTQTVLTRALEHKFCSTTNISISDLFVKFGRVLLEDSSCIQLADILHGSFPGPKLPYGQSSIAKIQFVTDIKSNSYQSIHLSNFCENDRAHSNQILNQLQPNDLIIRDLGYFVINVFRQIEKRSAYFLSRYNMPALLYNMGSGEEIDLVKELRKLDHKGVKNIDIEVLLGKKEKYKIRLVAFKLNKNQSKIRLNHAIKSRHNNKTLSERAKYLSTWNIFITNVAKEEWSTNQVYQAYSFRWHIEMTFKNWKSYFKINEFVKTCIGPNPARPEIILNLCMTFLTIDFVPKFNYYFKLILNEYNKYLSPFKFVDYLFERFDLWPNSSEKSVLEILSRYCCFEKRKDRKNHFEKLFTFS